MLAWSYKRLATFSALKIDEISSYDYGYYASNHKNWRFPDSGILNLFTGNGSLCFSSQLVKY